MLLPAQMAIAAAKSGPDIHLFSDLKKGTSSELLSRVEDGILTCHWSPLRW